jgi:hypothetical protein
MVPHTTFPQLSEEPRNFELAWNWHGDTHAYLVDVQFVLSEEAEGLREFDGGKSTYIGYRYLNGRNVEWCQLIETDREVMEVPRYRLYSAIQLSSNDAVPGYVVGVPTEPPLTLLWSVPEDAVSTAPPGTTYEPCQ